MNRPDRLPRQLRAGSRSSPDGLHRRFRALPLLALCGLLHGFPIDSFAASGPAHAVSSNSRVLPAPLTVSEKAADPCVAIAARLPGVSVQECQASKLANTGAISRNGLPIRARRIVASSREGNKPPVRVLLIGGIHGDELTSSAIVFRWLRLMNDPAARRFEWSVVPILNPDGMLTHKPTRMNAGGVDLNRNFPTPGWQKEAPFYWVRTTASDPRRYPGPSPLSEPETRWLNEEIDRFRPQVIVSVHAPFGVLDLDGPAPPPTRFGRLMFNRVGVYPGSLGNYSGRHRNIPVITIELPNAVEMPSEFEVKRIWQDMLGWMAHSVEPAGAVKTVSRRSGL
jgi:protein MpaA